MLGKLTECLMQEDDLKDKQDSFTDSVVMGENMPMYKKFALVQSGDELQPDEKQDLINSLNSAEVDNDMDKDSQKNTIIEACRK